MGENNNSKGSTDILAQAMKRVFKEAVEEGIVPLQKDMGTLREDVEQGLQGVREDLERGLQTTNQNVQRQLSEHRKNVASDFKTALSKS